MELNHKLGPLLRRECALVPEKERNNIITSDIQIGDATIKNIQNVSFLRVTEGVRIK